MMGTDPFLWIGIADPYHFPDPNPPLVTDTFPIPIHSFLPDPDLIAILPITDYDECYHFVFFC